MKEGHDFAGTQDGLLQSLGGKDAAAPFSVPSGPIPPVPKIPVILAQICGVSDCAEYFFDPKVRDAHVVAEHPDSDLSEGIVCYLQEVHDVSGVLRIQVLQGNLDDGAHLRCIHTLTQSLSFFLQPMPSLQSHR
jgi:hypothetical protein